MMGTLHWRAPLHPVFAAAMLLGLGVWLVVLIRRQRAQHSKRRAAALVLPKVVLVMLLMLASFDPVWRLRRRPDVNEKVAVLLDVSTSMDVRDAEDGARAQRAGRLMAALEDRLAPDILCEAYEFDQTVRRRENGRSIDQPVRDTDLGTCLMTMAAKPDISAYLGVIIVTDGGDELVQNARLPDVPVYVAGVGSDPDRWNDLAVAALDAPAVVERQSEFTVAAEILVRRASDRFAPKPTQVEVLLEESTAQGWVARTSQRIDLQAARQRVELTVESPAEEAMCDYRVRVEPLHGELSELNNVRTFSVDVGKDQLPVLLFAQEVGWDFGTVRKELARDPSLALTTLFRISEERFVIQDNRQAGDYVLEAGFPSEVAVLDLYKCVVLGSFPASQWQEAQMQALVEYVKGGGAAIFMGGVSSYGQGAYAGTALEALFPWTLDRASGGFRTGEFPVHIPAAVVNHGIVAEVHKALAQESGAVVESLNSVGPLRGGAVVLLEASVGRASVPVVAMQRYGQGHCLAIATDTLWRWTRASEATSGAFRHLWRQAVRDISQWAEGEQFLSVRWDQPRYRPGEQAVVKVNVAGRYDLGQVHLKAMLSGGVKPLDLNVQSVLGSANSFTTCMAFAERGEYTFRVEAFAGKELVESYEKLLRVGPTLNEGAKLEVDHAFLDYLASQSGGAYFPESESDGLAELLKDRVVKQAVTMDVPLVEYNYLYLLLLLGVLSLEWTVRRRMNLF